MFRQSLAPNHPSHANLNSNAQGEGGEGGVELSSIPLKDGRVMSFNPLNLSPGRMEDEMKASGLGEDEREKVKVKVKEEVVKALSERMERWSGML